MSIKEVGVCPFCNSDNTKSLTNEYDGEYLFEYYFCKNCRKQFAEIFSPKPIGYYFYDKDNRMHRIMRNGIKHIFPSKEE